MAGAIAPLEKIGSAVVERPASTGLPQIHHQSENLEALIDRLRERITVIAEADWVTHELLIAVTARLEQLHWMWQAEV